MDISTLSYLTGGMDMGNSIANALSDLAESSFTAQQYRFNQQIAGLQSEEALDQGKEQQQVSQERTAELGGQQKAAQAASGVNVNSGSALITRRQTGEIGGLDFTTIGNNAFLKSLGFKIQGLNDAGQAGMAQLAGTNKAMNDLQAGSQELFQNVMKGIDYENFPPGSTSESNLVNP